MANTVFSKIKLPNSDQSWYKYGIYPVKGTQTATTGTWTGTIDLPQLYDGLTIAYYLPTTGSGNATLNLTLADGTTTTGAVNVYWNGANRMTTHYPAGSTILLTYWSAGSIKVNGTATTDNRWTHCDYDSNSNTWRNIQLNGTQILGTGTSTGALNFVSGTGVSITNSSGSVTIAHADTSTQASVNNSGRTYIQDITLDDYGHVTGLTSATETVTNTDTKVTAVSNHYAPAEDSSAQLSASASGATAAWSIDVVKGITIKRDAKGHVTGVAVTSGKIPANPNTDTKVNVTLGTTTKAYLLATSTTPTSTAQAVTSIADTGVYLGTTAGELVVTKLSASAGVNANTANSNAAGGLALYSDSPTAYGVTMRGTGTSSGQLGKHGYVQGDWAGYFCFSGATNRGYIFRHASANVASISGEGNMVLNGSITLGGNSGNTSGCRQVYNSTTETLDFIFV